MTPSTCAVWCPGARGDAARGFCRGLFAIVLALGPCSARGAFGEQAVPAIEIEEGVSWTLAERRAATLSDLRYRYRLRIPRERSVPVAGTVEIRFAWSDPRARDLVLDFNDPARRVTAVRANGAAVDWAPPARSCHHSRPRPASGWAEPGRAGLRGGRRGPQPERRLPVYALRARPGALLAAPLRPTQSEGALRADPGGAGRLDRGGQRGGRRGAGPGRYGFAGLLALRRNPADSDLSVRVRGREPPGRDGGAVRPHDADVPSRDRCRQGRAQPGGDLRSARRRPRLARGLHRDSVSVRQVRFRAAAALPVRGDGASRLDLLPRVQPHAGRIGDPGRVSRAGQPSSPTRPRTCGSATSSR